MTTKEFLFKYIDRVDDSFIKDLNSLIQWVAAQSKPEKKEQDTGGMGEAAKELMNEWLQKKEQDTDKDREIELKYTTVKISGIITSVAKLTNVEGYTEDILQTVMPEDLQDMKQKYQKVWIKENNDRMQAICDMLNNGQGVKRSDANTPNSSNGDGNQKSDTDVEKLAEEWISVKERLPELLESVLVYNTERAILVGRRYSNDWVAYFKDGEAMMGELSPTHWQPLPQPPLVGYNAAKQTTK